MQVVQVRPLLGAFRSGGARRVLRWVANVTGDAATTWTKTLWTPVQIHQAALSHFKLKRSDLIGQSRARIYSYPRAMTMFLLRRLTRLSYPEIGMEFGGRDHSTVMYAVRKIEALVLVKNARVTSDMKALASLLSFTGVQENVRLVTPLQGTIAYYRENPQA